MIQVNSKPLGMIPAIEFRQKLQENGIIGVIHGEKRQGYFVSVVDERLKPAQALLRAYEHCNEAKKPGMPA